MNANTIFKSLCYILLFAQLTASGQTIKKLNNQVVSADRLSREIADLMSKAKVTGLGISILNANKPVYTHTFGYADTGKLKPDQVFYAASLSKAVFAYLVMQLVQEKVIDLDKPLVSYLSRPLPDYTFDDPNQGYMALRDDSRYQKITARMCLDHTTGLPNWRWFEPDEKLRIKFEPGSRYSYSGEGLYLLQFVIEQVTGKNMENLANAYVFKPLHMDNTSYLWRDDFAAHLVLGHDANGRPYKFKHRTTANAAGSLCTTLEDYAKFFAALMQHKGLKQATFQEMTRPQIRIRQIKQFGPLAWRDSTLNDSIQLSYGLGFGVFTTPKGPAFFKEGHDNGWQHYSVGFPDKGIAVIIMSNSDNAEGIFKALLETAIGDRWSPWFWENYIPAE